MASLATPAIADASEALIRLEDVPTLPWLPRRRAGKRLHKSTVFRWAKSSSPRLRTVRVGRALATRKDWLMQFFEASAGNAPPPQSAASAGVNRNDAAIVLAADGI